MLRRKSTSSPPLCLCFIGLLCLGSLMLRPCPAQAGEQARRAVEAVKRMAAEGEIGEDAVIKIVVKQGNIRNFWGRDFELKNEWEKQTGVRLDISTRPQKPVLEFMRQNENFDITVARQREYPDLVTEGYIAELTPLLRKHGFTLKSGGKDGFFLLESQSEFDGRLVAVPADGDVAVFYLRRDLLEDPGNRKRFEQQHHRELKAPETWGEYQRLVEFFHDPANDFYGSCEEREPSTGWMFWMPRYLSREAPYRPLFDEKMHPLIDSPAGIAATKSYVATVPFSPPGILKEGNNYSYTVPIFKQGRCFSSIITMAGAKIYGMEGSPIRGKFSSAPMPGSIIDGDLISRPTFIYGNNMVVAEASPNKDLAFLYTMWLTDPQISTRSIQIVGGFADPYRYNHLGNQRSRAIYSGHALDNMKRQFDDTVPAGTGLPGDAEYIDALNRNIWLAARGEQSAAEAMKKTAEAWDKITDRYGREQQIRYWRSFREKFPGGLPASE